MIQNRRYAPGLATSTMSGPTLASTQNVPASLAGRMWPMWVSSTQNGGWRGGFELGMWSAGDHGGGIYRAFRAGPPIRGADPLPRIGKRERLFRGPRRCGS